MPRSRTNGIQGDSIQLNAYFYKNNILKEPSSLGPVRIKIGDSVISSVAAGSVVSMGPGIKSLVYYVPADAQKDLYNDIWTDIVFESGDVPESKILEHYVKSRTWEVESEFVPPTYYPIMDNNDIVKLNEKKWLKFDIKDGYNKLQDVDQISILLKDYNGSNVYESGIMVNEKMTSFYYFNSSKLRVDYPEYINRDSNYEWVFKIIKDNQTLIPDTVIFKFSE